MTLFKRGGVDVAPQVEPLVTLMEQQGVAKRYKTAAEIRPDMETAFIVASGDWLDKDPCAAVAFARAYQRGASDMVESNGAWTPELEQIAAKAMDIPVSLVKALGNTPYAPPDGAVDAQILADAQDLFEKQGLIKKPVKVEDLIAPQISQALESSPE